MIICSSVSKIEFIDLYDCPNFLSKKLSEIFSVNISTRYTNFDKEHNKILISELINDKDEIKRNYFKMLFNLTFVDCLRHFNGSKNIQILNDMTLFSQLDIEDEKDEDYSKLLSFYINNCCIHILWYQKMTTQYFISNSILE